MQSDIITLDRRKPAQSWNRKLSLGTDFKECPCFQRWPPESKKLLPGILRNQYQGQRRPVWGFEAESLEIGKSGGDNRISLQLVGGRKRAQGKNGDMEISLS